MIERGGWVAIFVACVGGVIGCGQPADGMPPDSATPDTTAPKVVSGPVGNVSVLAKLTYVFDEPLDPATVTPANLRLTMRLEDSFPTVAGTVTYDASTLSVTFTPLRPLAYDGIYLMTLGALADPSGNVIEGGTVPVHTVINAITRENQFNNTNVMSGYVDATLDTYGRSVKQVNYDADVVATSHEEYTFRADGVWLQYRRYAIGNDNTWNTNDDPVVVRDEYTYDTSDDLRVLKFEEFVDNQTLRVDYGWTDRKLVSAKSYDNAGDDAMWNTPDDRGAQWRGMMQDATGATTRMTIYNNGSDGLPGTADDAISSSTVFERDPMTFALTKQTLYGGAGQDMTWLTSDDVVGNYTAFTTDDHGKVLTRVGYASKGNDMTWFTNDDVISSRQTSTYNASGLETNHDSFNGAGNDNMWGTNDDVLLSYTTTEYDAAGNRTKQILYVGPGNDNMWHTTDDLRAVERMFDTTH